MFKGFYNLTSGMLVQQRNLNVIANNMVNISTSGYKSDKYTSSTFDEVMMSLVGNKYKDPQEIGNATYIRASSEIYTDYTQGVLEPTGISLDFAIEGDGFFAVQSEAGEISYTRSGSFSLDEEGYLCYPGMGYILDNNEERIQLDTDKLADDNHGGLFTEDGVWQGQIGVFNFVDMAPVEHNELGFFTGGDTELVQNPTVHGKMLERSNVDMVKQMTEMISTQRAFQSAAQLSKMYDALMTKATTDVGRL